MRRINAHTLRLARDIIGNRALKAAFPALERVGLHVVRNHFYNPIPDTRRLHDSVFQRRSAMVGIEVDLDAQVARLKELSDEFKQEYRYFPQHQTEGQAPHFHMQNSSYGSVDAELYWCMLRSLKPKRVIEIGSGNSTLLGLEALRRNGEEGFDGTYTAIDPYPNVEDIHNAPGGFTLVKARVQDVPHDTFAELESGDILFIDSTHVASMDSDVCFEYLELLPRLKPGVYVHIHDIMLPMEYPKVWVKHLYFWNEQYLLQAFLSFNREFEVIWAGHMLALDRPQELAAAIPSFAPGVTEPGAFWIRRVGQAKGIK